VRTLPAVIAISALLWVTPREARAQAAAETTPASIDTTVRAGESEDEAPSRRLVKWNEYDGPVSSLRFGFGFLLDFAAYSQDAENEEQIPDLKNDIGVRDFRLLFRGKFKTKRPLSWTIGYMYDGADDRWRFRQTGIDVGIPELKGHLFLGRTKEGYSMVKVMVGYHPWTMERSPALDAFVPILADGAKWMGYFPGPRIHYSLGWFVDTLAEDEKFATYDHQAVGRVVWQPLLSESENQVLHVGVMMRDGKPDGNQIRVRSRPESNLAPYFVDTGSFAADHARATGIEAYYRKGSWLCGGEYNWQQVDALDGGSPMFHAGDAVVSVLLTGETRGYNAPGGFFKAVSPARTVFEGGPGAWEAVLHYSYTDFDDGSFRGGKLWKLSPMVNWHMSDNIRLEFLYGYSMLDRFDLKGATHFFQSRIQTTL